MKILNPPGWSRPSGYSNGVAAQGEMVFVSGTIGWDQAGVLKPDFAGQFEQLLDNVVAILAEAGAGPEHIVRMTWYVTDLDAYRSSLKEIGAAYLAKIGKNFPTMAVIGVSGLVEADALVEIETTAVIPTD
jgi:enamine deaminase RidA (YjgF/YER057c/UK114 family)